MHELSLAQSMVETVEATLRSQGIGVGEAKPPRILALKLLIGALAGVHEESLSFCYELATAGTLLEGSKLVVVQLPIIAWCPGCQAEIELPSLQNFHCPTCASALSDIRQGRELEIDSVEVED